MLIVILFLNEETVGGTGILLNRTTDYILLRAVVVCIVRCILLFQCGADSLGNDRLGCFNLTTKGHGLVNIVILSAAWRERILTDFSKHSCFSDLFKTSS